MASELEEVGPVELQRIETKKHPIQPLEYDEHGTLRYKRNQIVCDLLDKAGAHGLDLNAIATKGYTQDDQAQLAQLIGYSHGGAQDLSYFPRRISRDSYLMFTKSISEEEARVQNLDLVVTQVKELVSESMSVLYGLHPEDIRDFVEENGKDET